MNWFHFSYNSEFVSDRVIFHFATHFLDIIFDQQGTIIFYYKRTALVSFELKNSVSVYQNIQNKIRKTICVKSKKNCE